MTRLGVLYQMPDMLSRQVDAVVEQLHGPYDQVTAMNISECCLLMPKRIIHKAGEGERCFWEANE